MEQGLLSSLGKESPVSFLVSVIVQCCLEYRILWVQTTFLGPDGHLVLANINRYDHSLVQSGQSMGRVTIGALSTLDLLCDGSHL